MPAPFIPEPTTMTSKLFTSGCISGCARGSTTPNSAERARSRATRAERVPRQAVALVTVPRVSPLAEAKRGFSTDRREGSQRAKLRGSRLTHLGHPTAHSHRNSASHALTKTFPGPSLIPNVRRVKRHALCSQRSQLVKPSQKPNRRKVIDLTKPFVCDRLALRQRAPGSQNLRSWRASDGSEGHN
jgi:hypothetical protein